MAEWIRLVDRTPDLERDGKGVFWFPCLAVIRDEQAAGGRFIDKVWFNGFAFVNVNNEDLTDQITHWRTMPELPKEVQC